MKPASLAVLSGASGGRFCSMSPAVARTTSAKELLTQHLVKDGSESFECMI